MGKFSALLETIVGIGLEFTPLAPIGTSLILAGVTSGISSLFARSAKPETTETSVKSPLAPRVDAFGISRLHAAGEIYS